MYTIHQRTKEYWENIMKDVSYTFFVETFRPCHKYPDTKILLTVENE